MTTRSDSMSMKFCREHMIDPMFRPAWTPATIGLMVLGFIFWKPLGFVVLGYILFGGKAREWIAEREHDWRKRRQGTGNSAFDAYREAELERLEAERRQLDEERAEFEEFLYNLRKARDRDEFDKFAKSRKKRARKS